MTNEEILRHLKFLDEYYFVENKNWTRGAYQRGDDCFCFAGAVNHVLRNKHLLNESYFSPAISVRVELYYAIVRFLPLEYRVRRGLESAIIRYNDEKDRKFEDIKLVLKNAIDHYSSLVEKKT